MRRKRVYDLYYRNYYAGTYTARALAERLGTSLSTVMRYYYSGEPYKGRYRIRNGVPDEFDREWKAACRKVRRRYGWDEGKTGRIPAD